MKIIDTVNQRTWTRSLRSQLVGTLLLLTGAGLFGEAAFGVRGSSTGDTKTPGIQDVTLPPGYRDWRVISVAHEAGKINDIRAILGNDMAFKAAKDGTIPFPDGAIIARLAWVYTPSEANNKVFGNNQSFIAGSRTNVQFLVKDSRKFAATGGWGFAQFGKDNSANAAVARECFTCHVPAKHNDYVFTHYAP
jgi:hypothetical protein